VRPTLRTPRLRGCRHDEAQHLHACERVLGRNERMQHLAGRPTSTPSCRGTRHSSAAGGSAVCNSTRYGRSAAEPRRKAIVLTEVPLLHRNKGMAFAEPSFDNRGVRDASRSGRLASLRLPSALSAGAIAALVACGGSKFTAGEGLDGGSGGSMAAEAGGKRRKGRRGGERASAAQAGAATAATARAAAAQAASEARPVSAERRATRPPRTTGTRTPSPSTSPTSPRPTSTRPAPRVELAQDAPQRPTSPPTRSSSG